MFLNKKIKSGFTLVEMLIVVAIIAVLVAIAIPVFSNVLKKSKEATCSQNRRSLKSELTYVYIDGDSNAVQKKYDEIISQYTCPEGGKLTYHLGEDGVVTVTCSIHNAPADIINDALKNSNIDISSIKHLDSTDTSRTDIINSLKGYFSDSLKAAGANIDANGGVAPKSWAIIKTDENVDKSTGSGAGTLLIWSDRDISKYSGKEVQTPAMCYNVSNGRYTVGISNVIKLNSNNYYSLGQEAETNGFASHESNSGKTFGTYEEAKKYYDELSTKY